MSWQTLFILFGLAIVADLVLTPALGGAIWLPYFSLLLLPFIFTFADPIPAGAVFIVEALIIWLATDVNIGIIVFALGILVLFERWLVPQLLHTSTWQATVIGALGIPLFALTFAALALVLPGEPLVATGRLIVGFFITTLGAAITTALLKNYYVS